MSRFVFLIVLALLTVAIPVRAEDAKPVTYDDHIAPIFKRHCWQCHGEAKQESGLNLASYAAVLKGGQRRGRGRGWKVERQPTHQSHHRRRPG